MRKLNCVNNIKICAILLCNLIPWYCAAQIVSGPMLADVTYRTANIWVGLRPNSNLNCWVWPKGSIAQSTVVPKMLNTSYSITTCTYTVEGLQPNTTYEYDISAAKKPTKAIGTFTTKANWAYRATVPDVHFITGSCAYINDTAVDRVYTDMVKLNKTAKPYGGNYNIFTTMAATNANMMLWLGDNWYTREVDWSSKYGLHYRPYAERQLPQLQPLLKAMPNYAIWDDHDYGPNDGDMSYVLASESRNVFQRYWANPSYGNGSKGIYTKVTLADVEFFMLDDRTWRSNDAMNDSINGQPNAAKRMLGAEQMHWLKNALLQSQANFKIIVTGSQTLNPISPYDCMQDFPVEYNELMNFFNEEKITGLLFLTGDRHHTEVIKLERPNTYPLYDVTVSPLTSGTHTFGGVEKNNTYRVLGIDEKQNFASVKVTGALNDRVMTFAFIGVQGEQLGVWSVKANDLKK